MPKQDLPFSVRGILEAAMIVRHGSEVNLKKVLMKVGCQASIFS
jgi:hypothetical protein